MACACLNPGGDSPPTFASSIANQPVWLLPLAELGLSAGHAALVRRHARYYFVLRDRARVFAGRVFARLCPTAAFTIALSACSLSFSF
jgi:hypothetical protein